VNQPVEEGETGSGRFQMWGSLIGLAGLGGRVLVGHRNVQERGVDGGGGRTRTILTHESASTPRRFPGPSSRHVAQKSSGRPIGPSNGHGSERGRELAAAVFFLLLRAGGTPQHGSGRGRDQEIRRREAAALATGCSF